MTTSLPFTLDVAGCCTHPGRVTRPDASWRPLRFPAMFGVVHHPREGVVLIDTGYAPRFEAATARFPARLYRLLTPMTLSRGETAVERLAARGVAADDVRTIVVTHFHADHIAGLRDFPRARIVFAASAWDAVATLRGLSAVRKAFLPALLPDDFAARAVALDDRVGAAGVAGVAGAAGSAGSLRALPPVLAPFDRGFDLLGDGSMWGVPLPGHATGQLGVFFDAAALSSGATTTAGAITTSSVTTASSATTAAGPTLIAADAAWHSDSIRRPHDLHPLARLLSPDHRGWRATLDRLHALAASEAVRVVPLHCAEVAAGAGWSLGGGP